ncbi:bifunctional 3-dehydroquinate dehydratase/shikimate dehydrogenase, chloroplastic-like [Quillaja saponaria]|uniref:Bifunctional 3-dehydroquinate dehydratase/shikimate dehydrogenase, chloroplastic-like n=1 Tax=Quillaja saponaria TaxID=32244 RepID=A0AAD7LD01_QUISA|nr:bifunctional 3-dehydroquinate dehydratase/shikimate dehydrogenase, chloroplastic-like [Quillaja saponaria]
MLKNIVFTQFFCFLNAFSLLIRLFFRPKWEGGQYDGVENKRLDVLRIAMELGADYVDVELQFIDSISGKNPENTKVIVSSHNYQYTPSVEDLGNLMARMQATGADIVKIATTALDIADVERIFQITVHSQLSCLCGIVVPVVGLVMGDRGLISRVLCPKFGGYLTFGTLKSGVVSAPGQQALKVFCVRTHPQISWDSVLQFLTGRLHLSAVAKLIGAVNYIIRRSTDGKLIGYNTDYFGAISAIEDGLRGKHNSSSITGARVVIVNRTYERARELATSVRGDALALADLDNYHPEDGMILANTTSIGMQPKVDDTPISKHALGLIFDAVYTPKITRLLREAEESGATIILLNYLFSFTDSIVLLQRLRNFSETLWQITSEVWMP